MIHLGDITAISGYTAPLVDVIIGGSPCQDLSIAGGRAGLAGTRSGLFMEQIRIIKEMRNADRKSGRTGQLIRPRFMVWENVPGAFSSNKGEDFRIVLEETVRVAEDAVIPRSPDGKWRKSGCIMGDGWSIAWRVLDAQFWGVPQRRRRIALVADFGGHAAPEILFVRQSVCGDTPAGTAERKETAGRTGSGTYPAVARCLTSRNDGSPCIDRGPQIVWCLQGNGIDRADTAGCNGKGWRENIAYTLNTVDRPAVCALYENHGQDSRITGSLDIAPTVSQKFGTGGNNAPLVMASGQAGAEILHNISPTLMSGHEHLIVAAQTVRRLTPLECERLQGFPDGWTDIGAWTDSKGRQHKESSDSARYKALGNSIAIPPWTWVLKRLCACYEHPATMASLFDGIGGFPLIWERLNGQGSCLWCSEIEEFPTAVTKRRL